MSVGSVPKCCGCIILSPVGVSHFANYDTYRPLIVWEMLALFAYGCMLTNVQKSSIPQWWRKWKSDPKSTRASGSPPKSLTSRGSPLPVPAKFGRRPFPRSSVILFTESQNGRQNDHITSASLVEVTTIISLHTYALLLFLVGKYLFFLVASVLTMLRENG